ncbi:MAG: hypothetical protein ACOWWH_03740 [Eubacteriaceae bacterium]
MKRLLVILIMIPIMLIVLSSSVSASEDNYVFKGLYLINGENIQLNKVDINISVENASTSTVSASYEITNVGEELQYVYLGTPMTNLKMTNFKSKFTPYLYKSVISSGDKINSMIQDLDVDFANWRTYSIPLALKVGETKTAEINYSIENYQEYSGKAVFNLDLDHLAVWGSLKEEITIKINFNPRTVKLYNFDNNFNIEPQEMTTEYTYIWNLSDYTKAKEINFNYYFVDGEILNQLEKINSSQVDSMIKNYNKKEYDKVISIGKKYISSDNSSKYQNKVYILMVDSYIALKKYEEALLIYDLIETGTSDFGDIGEKIEEKFSYNKVICYKGLEQYEDMYDLIQYEINYGNLNSYIIGWFEKQEKTIPEDVMIEIKESRKELSSVEKYFKKFMQGEYSKAFYIGAIIIILFITIILYIIRKRRKNKYFF